ncbi:MAG: hypothetical protein ABEI86_05435, partial [Halobacteriaceae archaeon]
MNDVDIGFIHINYPRRRNISESSAATEYIRYIDRQGGDVTIYCPVSSSEQDDLADDLDTQFLDVEFSFPNHKGEEINRAILKNREIVKHDVIHCYTGRAIPALGKLSKQHDIKTIITLNAYNSLCPKNDLLFLNQNSCKNRGDIKCSACTIHSNLSKLKNGTSIKDIIGIGHTQTNQFRDIRILNQVPNQVDNIDMFHVYSDHSKDIYEEFGFPIDKFKQIPLPVNEAFQS